MGLEVWQQWCEKALDTAGYEAEIRKFLTEFDDLRAALRRDLVASKTVAKCIEESGGPVRASDMAAPEAEFARGCAYARYLRNRFTILDLAAELGVTT